MSRFDLPFSFNKLKDGTKEILALIDDLDLVPRNYEAMQFFDIVDLVRLERERVSFSMSALSSRNRSRKFKDDVFKTSCDNLSLPFE